MCVQMHLIHMRSECPKQVISIPNTSDRVQSIYPLYFHLNLNAAIKQVLMPDVLTVSGRTL